MMTNASKTETFFHHETETTETRDETKTFGTFFQDLAMSQDRERNPAN